MLSHEPNIALLIIPRKDLSSLKDRRKIFKFLENFQAFQKLQHIQRVSFMKNYF